MEQPKLKKKIIWKLPTIMSDREVYTQSHLQELLKGVGVIISTPQLSRMHKRLPEFIKSEVLEGLLTVLDCDITDIIQVKEVTFDDDGESEEKPVTAKKSAIVRKIEKNTQIDKSTKPKSAVNSTPATVFEIFKDKVDPLKGLTPKSLPKIND